MKHFCISIVLFFCTMISYAQNTTTNTTTEEVVVKQPTTVKVYAEIVFRDHSSYAKSIKFDFGKNSLLGSRYPEFKDNAGNVIKFTAIVDALNYMSQRGWVLETVYKDEYIEEGDSYGSEKHYVISKTIAVE